MSMSHFWLTNSAVQMTSDWNTSHSLDFACWRWTNALRCSSAEAGNSISFAFRPWLAYLALNWAIALMIPPLVSLPAHSVDKCQQISFP